MARRLCLETLVLELVSVGAVGLTLDRRNTPHKVKRDLQTMVEIVKNGIAPKGFGYATAQPSDDPLLWLADAVAGATHDELDGDPRYCVALGPTLIRIQA